MWYKRKEKKIRHFSVVIGIHCENNMMLIYNSEITICINKFTNLVPRSLLLPKRVERLDPELVSPGFFCSRSNCKKECTRAVLQMRKHCLFSLCTRAGWIFISLGHKLHHSKALWLSWPLHIFLLSWFTLFLSFSCPFPSPYLSFPLLSFSHAYTISTCSIPYPLPSTLIILP